MSSKLSPNQVARMDKGRSLAEASTGRRGPGRPRKDGSPPQPRPASVQEAAKRVQGERTPEAPAKTKKAEAPAAEWREPTKGEVAQVRFFMKMGNKPLKQLERDLAELGLVGKECPPALVKTGEIPATKSELDMGAHCTAGSIIALAPSIAPYMSIIGLACFTVGFIGSRLLIFWRIQRAMKAEERAHEEKLARAAQQAPSKLNPTAAPPAPPNGTAAPKGELTKLAP